jgi:hypothetical protein
MPSDFGKTKSTVLDEVIRKVVAKCMKDYTTKEWAVEMLDK